MTELVGLTAPEACANCRNPLKRGASFCGICGSGLNEPAQLATQASAGTAWRHPRTLVIATGILILVGALAGEALLGRSETAARRADARSTNRHLSDLQHAIDVVAAQNASLASRLRAAEGQVKKANAGSAPLAAKVLKSVFTVETSDGEGTGWAAWVEGDSTYVITANHVVSSVAAYGDLTVKLHRKGSTWDGRVIKTDAVNDLAVIRVRKRIGTPLWQDPSAEISPSPGDELLLVGSPYGLEGTVTQGVVSRVSYNEIQTDAAANPGNSGGPAVDKQGHIVGVLLAGGGENLNFTVPIQRACVTVRKC
jgi:S1-C subfamily serine protease